MHVVEPARVALHLIDSHGLISIRQEHDISARVLSTVTRDHEPRQPPASTWSSPTTWPSSGKTPT
jgi:hypothetical protein